MKRTHGSSENGVCTQVQLLVGVDMVGMHASTLKIPGKVGGEVQIPISKSHLTHLHHILPTVTQTDYHPLSAGQFKRHNIIHTKLSSKTYQSLALNPTQFHLPHLLGAVRAARPFLLAAAMAIWCCGQKGIIFDLDVSPSSHLDLKRTII